MLKKQEKLEEEKKQEEAKKQRAEEKKRRKEEFEKLQALKQAQENIADEEGEKHINYMIGFFTITPEDIEDVVPDAKKSVGRSGEQCMH